MSNRTSLSAGIAIRHLLTRSSDVTALARKVYPIVVDRAQLPYVFYRRVNMQQNPQKQGLGADTVAVEVVCMAEDYDTSLQLAEAVREALDHRQYQGEGLTMRSCTLTDSSEDYQDDAFIQSLIFNIKI